MLNKMLLLVGALSIAFALNAQELKLPEKLPELKVSSEASLGKGTQGLRPGAAVPKFSIDSHKGEPVSWGSLLERAPLLVVFYRGGWCPYCNVQIRQLTEAWPEFEKRGVTPVLISADKPDAAAIAQAGYSIPFPVLSDPDMVAHKVFDVVVQIDEATAKKYREYGIVLEDWSGREHHQIGAPGVFLVAKNGRVTWAHVSADYRERPSVAQLLAAIDAQ